MYAIIKKIEIVIILIYKTLVQLTLSYSSELRTIGRTDKRRITTAKMGFVRTVGYTLLGHTRNEYI
jgi:hypothetical protein